MCVLHQNVILFYILSDSTAFQAVPYLFPNFSYKWKPRLENKNWKLRHAFKESKTLWEKFRFHISAQQDLEKDVKLKHSESSF